MLEGPLMGQVSGDVELGSCREERNDLESLLCVRGQERPSHEEEPQIWSDGAQKRR